MRTNRHHLRFKIAVGLLIPAMLSVQTMRAEELVPWAELQAKTFSRQPGATRYRIVTKRGDSYVGFFPVFGPADVRFDDGGSGSPIRREDVAEIRIHRVREPIWEPLFYIAAAPQGARYWGLDTFLAILLEPVAVGAAAAAAPIILPIEGIKRLLPDRVIKVAP